MRASCSTWRGQRGQQRLKIELQRIIVSWMSKWRTIDGPWASETESKHLPQHLSSVPLLNKLIWPHRNRSNQTALLNVLCALLSSSNLPEVHYLCTESSHLVGSVHNNHYVHLPDWLKTTTVLCTQNMGLTPGLHVNCHSFSLWMYLSQTLIPL